MSRARTGARRRAIVAEVEKALGEGPICGACGATFASFGEKCSAALDYQCEGFRRIDEARSRAAARIYKLKP